jgi:hypothetical protein
VALGGVAFPNGAFLSGYGVLGVGVVAASARRRTGSASSSLAAHLLVAP